MVRSREYQLREVVRGGGYIRYRVADLFYGTDRRKADLPIMDLQLTWNASSQIQGSGTCRVVWQSDFAESMAPKRLDDWLAPFGAALYIRDVFELGSARWEVPLGWFNITDVPSARESRTFWGGRAITVGSVVELTLQDRMERTKRHRFGVPTGPEDLSSAINEAARITGLPVTRSTAVPDRPVPRSIVYSDDRLEALYELCKVVLDAVPYMAGDGSLAFRPREWPDPVDEVVYGGPDGTITDIDWSMSPTNAYNLVSVRSEGGDDAEVLYRDYLRTGPLRAFNPDGTEGPWGVTDLRLVSQYIESRFQAAEWGQRELRQLERVAVTGLKISLGYNSLYEVGDVLKVVDRYSGTEFLYRITTLPLDDSPEMTITGEVAA